MVAILSIVIGIIFVMLLFSLLTTTVMELASGLLALRGKHLMASIRDMIGDLADKFQEHPYYQQLASSSNPGTKTPNPPSYIGSGTFSAILGDLLRKTEGNNLQERLESLPESRFKEVLLFLYNESNGEVASFKGKTEEWFNEVMDRGSGAYKKKTKNWLIAIGFCIAVLFNVDPLNIYSNLSMNATLREYIAGMATEYVNTQPAPSDTISMNTPIAVSKIKMDSLLSNNIASISQPLGIGWSDSDWNTSSGKWWLYKLVGWITTALALSMGAAFWFDLLKQLVSFRSSGPPAASSSGLSKSSGQDMGRPGTETNRAIRQAPPPPDKSK
ncbi:MAG: hypothetical protein IPL65_19805 [Lewinellaceae bacterium]|nr:hypothetical protein [Lewinellaceae bacterium]